MMNFNLVKENGVQFMENVLSQRCGCRGPGSERKL